MALRDEFNIDLEQALIPTIKLLKETGIFEKENKEEINTFLMKYVSHAYHLALASVHLQSNISDYQFEQFFKVGNVNEFMTRHAEFMIRHAEYAPILAQIIVLLVEAYTLNDEFDAFLRGNHIEELKTSTIESPQYAAQLALAKIKLKSSSPLLQECLHEKDLVQSAQHALEIFRAMAWLEHRGFLKNQKHIPQLKTLLAQYGEYACKFAKAIIILGNRNSEPDLEFLSSDWLKILLQCPVKYVDRFAKGIRYLNKKDIFNDQECFNFNENNILDQEHMDYLLANGGENGQFMGIFIRLLKHADQGTGILSSKDNILRIIKHVKPELMFYWLSCATESGKLVVDKDHFDMMLRYTRFGREIAAILEDADQPELDQLLKEIDREVELQRRPFMQGMRSVNAANTGIGRFFQHNDSKNLCEKIFDFLPNPEIPTSTQKRKLG